MFAVFVVAAGCEGAHFAGAEREDSEPAYLRYLARHPEGTRSAVARSRLEELRFETARRADRPLAYRRYLEQHPGGRYAAAASERLAALALARVSDAAGLELVVERYRGAPQAGQAASRLPALRARAALASQVPATVQRYLDRHPDAPEAAEVRRHLAALRYRSLPDDPAELEAFCDEHAGTPSAGLARGRLERVLVRELRESCDPQLLQEFRTRFPSSEALASLAARAVACERERALLELDLEALATSAPADRAVRELVRWCRGRQPRCATLRSLVRRAGPYRSAGKLEGLRSSVYDPDLKLAWRAIEELAWLGDPGAGAELAELAGSPRLSVVWRAATGLEGWLGRLGVERRRGWLSRQLGRPWRQSNQDEVQRRAVLELLAGREAAGEARLLSLGLQPAHALTSGYLLVEHLARRGRRAPSQVRDRFAAALRQRARWLRDSFPNELNRDSAAAGALAERELFALEQAVGGLGTTAAASELEQIRREAASLLAGWRARLTKANASFEPARLPVELALAAAQHEQARGAALRELRSWRPGGELLAEAVCRASRVAGCPESPKAEE
jgi:hypothetical protein